MTKTEIKNSLVKQLELRGMNAEFYMDMIDDYVYYWTLKKKLWYPDKYRCSALP